MANTPKDSARSRKVAILAADGVDAKAVGDHEKWLLTEARAQAKVVRRRDGRARRPAGGGRVPVDWSLLHRRIGALRRRVRTRWPEERRDPARRCRRDPVRERGLQALQGDCRHGGWCRPPADAVGQAPPRGDGVGECPRTGWSWARAGGSRRSPRPSWPLSRNTGTGAASRKAARWPSGTWNDRATPIRRAEPHIAGQGIRQKEVQSEREPGRRPRHAPAEARHVAQRQGGKRREGGEPELAIAIGLSRPARRARGCRPKRLHAQALLSDAGGARLSRRALVALGAAGAPFYISSGPPDQWPGSGRIVLERGALSGYSEDFSLPSARHGGSVCEKRGAPTRLPEPAGPLRGPRRRLHLEALMAGKNFVVRQLAAMSQRGTAGTP